MITMINIIAGSVFRRPWFYIAGFIIISLFFAAFIPLIHINGERNNQLQGGSRTILNTHHIENLFGGNDSITIILSTDDVLNQATLERIKKISSQLELVKDFDKVVSLFTLKNIINTDGRMLVESFIEEIPADEIQRESLRNALRGTDSTHEKVVTEDFKHTAIIGYLNRRADDEVVQGKINKILGNCPGTEEITVGGFPMLRNRVVRDMIDEIILIFGPICLLFMLIVLFLTMRQFRSGILPISILILSVIPAWGLIFLLGWDIQTATLFLPGLIIAVCCGSGIHMVSRYQEENTPGAGLSNIELAEKSLLSIGTPSITCGIITILCIFSLLSYVITPAWQMGILAAAGTAFSLLGGLLFIPAWLSILPRPRPTVVFPGSDKLLRKISSIVIGHPLKIFIAITALTALLGTGIQFLDFDANPENYYNPESPIIEANNQINKNFNRSSSLSILVRGDIKDPTVLKKIDQFENDLKKLPGVGSTMSIAGVVRSMNQTMNGGNSLFNSIPDDRETISNYFMQHSVSGDASDFNRLLDFSYQHAQITVRINDGDTNSIHSIVSHINKYIEQDKDSHFVMMGGIAASFADMADKIESGMISSIFIALLIAGIGIGILFRSPIAAIIAVIPPVFSLLLVFGSLGHINVTLNMSTALLSSISIAVGIDYSIHYLWRYKKWRTCGLDRTEAMKTTLATSGKDILFSALTLIAGFSVFIFSDFALIRSFGIIVVAGTSACLICTLLLLPAICLILKPGFLEPDA